METDKILYVSRALSQQKFNKLFNGKKNQPSQSMKFHRLMAEGFAKNNKKITILSSLPVNREMTKKIFLFEGKGKVNGVNYRYLPIINIPVIKIFFVLITSFFYSLFFLMRNKKSYMVADCLCQSIVLGALAACKILRRKSIGILTDFPEMMAYNKNQIKTNNKIIDKFSSYVFLTEQMNEVKNIKGKPYVIIEGVADTNMQIKENDLLNKYEKKVCIYAGSLENKYGINNLITAFIKADVNNSELHIYGGGGSASEIEKFEKTNEKIKFFGYKDNDYIVNQEIKAILLINPRPSDGEYTKYSFPSKNMEYMVSGTPVLTTKLPGMPKEYYDYVYLINDESVSGLTSVLTDILNKPLEELYSMGAKAKQFVLYNKNNVIQAKKIIDLIEKSSNKLEI